MVRTKRRSVALLSILGVATLLAACAGQAGEAEPEPSSDNFEILAIYPLSGPLAPYGQAAAAGVQAAADVANAEGGIDGRTVEVTLVDDAYDASKAVTALQDYLATNDKPDLLIPGLSSQEILAVLPIATQHGIFTTSTAASSEANDPERFPYAFHVLVESDEIAAILVESFTEKGYESVAFLGPDNATGRAGLESVERVAVAQGLRFVGELLDPTAADATPSLLRLQEANPDVLVLDGLGPTAGVFLAGRTKLDWDVPAIGTPTFASNNLGAVSDPADWDGVELLAWGWAVEGTEATTSERFEKYRAALGAERLEMGHPAYGFGYNMVVVAWAAYEGAETDELDDLVSVLVDGTAPEAVRARSLGPADFGYTGTNRFQSYGTADMVIVPAGPIVDGLLVAP